MPFGLCNAPATFERMMDNLLRNFKWTMCLCYLDDIIVFSETFEDHLLRLVLKCLQEAGLKLNSKSVFFAAQEVKILGHHVSSNGVRPDPDKIKPILQEGLPDGPSDFKSMIFLKYKTGKKHSDADALSRNSGRGNGNTKTNLAVTTSMNLAMEQKKDQDLAKLKLFEQLIQKTKNSDSSTVSFAGRILIQMESCGYQSFLNIYEQTY
ncbi:retrovirus-related Pol polyprotein from transposon 17.6 [Trichonephila clavipes]|uniref:Retrovirus-related Pol polyprotein from transposon 17.6 n=1 Tax=Trichonephila clavipes TaxID=2585209 RepID=A0A8X6VK48_TRICX|nr:retrovirus-related Pol polyprotein from transposon 17.6 [Trichonephila clavipes]